MKYLCPFCEDRPLGFNESYSVCPTHQKMSLEEKADFWDDLDADDFIGEDGSWSDEEGYLVNPDDLLEEDFNLDDEIEIEAVACDECQGSGGGSGYWQCPNCNGSGLRPIFLPEPDFFED